MNFKDLRIKCGFRTAKELANKLNMPLPRVQKWDGGKNRPRDLRKVAKALGVTTDELLKCFEKKGD